METQSEGLLLDPDSEVEEDCYVTLKSAWRWFYPKYLDQRGYVQRIGTFLGDCDEVAEVRWADGDTCYYETKMLVRVLEN